MAAVVWDIRKICMGNHVEKNFEWQYLSQDGRYRVLTSRYSYKVAERIGI